MYRSFRTRFSNWLLLAGLLLPAQAAAQAPRLMMIQAREAPTGMRFEILCTGEARYAHYFQDEPPAVVVILENVRMPQNTALLVDPGIRHRVRLQPWNEGFGGVRVEFRVGGQTAYQIRSSGGLIWLQFQEKEPELKTNGYSTRAAIKYQPDDALLRKLGNGTRISVDFRDAEIGNVLRMLARQNGFNIVAGDSVKGKITVTLKNVTIEQALESILRANGYTYRIENGVVLVNPMPGGFNIAQMETRVYRLKYIDAHNLKKAIEDLKSRDGKISVLTASFHNRDDIYDVNKKQAPQRERKYWLRSSVLLVTDYPTNLRAIDALVRELDVPVPQIMIEARLIETAPQHDTNIGIDWSKALSAQLFNEIVFEGGTVYRYSTRTDLEKGGGIMFGTLNTSQFNAVLNFLKTRMNSRLLSNPRILAMDNEPSDISVGTNVPIPQITRGVGGQGDIVTFSYKDVNITLRVIPHVVDANTITMYVNPIIEEITGQVTVDRNTAPITSRREVDTVVKVRNGDTIVIGGMIKEQTVVRVDKVWLLGSIPLLGHLFRNQVVQKQQTDLLIFITPKIVQQ
ncbi:MAG: secretin and TonB N-terminal domain-containing protein [candidate division KSB1 bacterium]|nr:secretin and TonB N-terminal domain-containing protein [candidate division KSB1 bacterium]